MFLLINKPKGITSHDVIYKLRKITGVKKIGHGGTLDPAAEGLLIVGVERESTKKLGEVTQNTTKTYEAEIYLGATSSTDDTEGIISIVNKNLIPTKVDILKVLDSFKGESQQTPPVYSAIKLSGKKAYELARIGKEFKLESRKITIYSIKLIEYQHPKLKILCEVSAGTYIRALARDIGEKLTTGAYLLSLRRTKVGNYDISKSVALDQLTSDNWKDYII